MSTNDNKPKVGLIGSTSAEVARLTAELSDPVKTRPQVIVVNDLPWRRMNPVATMAIMAAAMMGGGLPGCFGPEKAKPLPTNHDADRIAKAKLKRERKAALKVKNWWKS